MSHTSKETTDPELSTKRWFVSLREPDKRATEFLAPWFTLLQSLAMYFMAAGFAWIGVYGTARHHQMGQESQSES
ncbi:MAG: hypothetical protein AAGD07_02645 [Planctomycetota bacterium]